MRTLIRFSDNDNELSLPQEEETLPEKVLRTTGYDQDAIMANIDDDHMSVVESIFQHDNESPSESGVSSRSSLLFGPQKLFNTEESKEIKKLCNHIALSGKISIERIQSALQKTSLGSCILQSYKIQQIQTRIKYERRQLTQ